MVMWDLNTPLTWKPLWQSTIATWAASYLPLRVSRAQHGTWHKSGAQSCCLKVTLFITAVLLHCVYSNVLSNAAALSWPLSLRVSRTGLAWPTSPSSTGLPFLKPFFTHMHKKIPRQRACFARTHIQVRTMEGRLIINMAAGRRACKFMMHCRLKKKNPQPGPKMNKQQSLSLKRSLRI